MRFTLIDKITQVQPGESLTAIKTLSLAEEYLQDHFPGFPIMPGVLMVEAMVQASAWLMRASEDFKYSTVLLKEAKGVKFNNFVSPGKTLEIVTTVLKKEEGSWSFKVAGTMEGTSAVNARLVLEQFNLSSQNPEMKSADDLELASLRSLYAVLWRGGKA
ncbi:3-hydroxyacyl-ACP dehydratase FabZ family protein [Planctomicrobium sp. SH668]|uniref:3-hydroxyacyl-ACP dehydratase FabZ family protein n=1 Tax=Planctomicrobium sp. SH668 TaxID=3448126 RepID=UPI003F5B81EF